MSNKPLDLITLDRACYRHNLDAFNKLQAENRQLGYDVHYDHSPGRYRYSRAGWFLCLVLFMGRTVLTC